MIRKTRTDIIERLLTRTPKLMVHEDTSDRLDSHLMTARHELLTLAAGVVLVEQREVEVHCAVLGALS